jgi:hypothetical protein
MPYEQFGKEIQSCLRHLEVDPFEVINLSLFLLKKKNLNDRNHVFLSQLPHTYIRIYKYILLGLIVS